jgi:DNA-binding protein Fis
MTTTSADYIHFLNGSQVGDLYELAVVRNGEFEVM